MWRQTLTLFSIHDKVKYRKTMPISTDTSTNIAISVVAESLEDALIGTITPHSLRHYFVTIILK